MRVFRMRISSSFYNVPAGARGGTSGTRPGARRLKVFTAKDSTASAVHAGRDE